MRKLYILMSCIVGVMIMTSCAKSKSDHVIDGFEDLVEEVEEKKGKFTVEEWKSIEQDFNKRFEELGIDDIDEKEFSALQKLELTALVVRWTAAMAGSASTLIESSAEMQEEKSLETE